MSPIRVSEIGDYLYCRRAWWYRQKGYTSENKQELESGQVFHRKHARLVWQMLFTRTVALLLLLLALMLLVAYCTVHL